MTKLPVHRTLVLITLVVVLLLVLAACGGSEPAATPPATPAAPAQATTAPQATATAPVGATAQPSATAVPTPTPAPSPTATTGIRPKTGGTYKTAASSDPGRLAPLTANLAGDIVRLEPVMNGLLQWDPYKIGQKEILPYLAESWTATSDGLGFAFKIRQGLKWQDGNPLTIKDVLFSMDLMQKGHMAAQFAKIDKVEAVDGATLRITLKQLDPDFLVKFAQPHTMVLPSHLTADQFKQNPIGTGPFKWASFSSGASTKFVRNDQYFKAPYPYLDGLQVFTIGDDALSLNAFRTGDLDRSDASKNYLNAKDVQERVAKAIAGVQYRAFASGLPYVLFNQAAPWTDQRVRKAFNLSLDRSLINDIVHAGTAYQWAGSWLAPALGGALGLSEAEMKQMPGFRQPKDADYAESKRLLKEVGVDGSQIELNFIGRQYPDGPGAAAQSVALGGFTGKVTIRNIPDLAAFSSDFNRANFSLAYNTFGQLLDLPEGYIPDLYMVGGLSNPTKWDNPRINELYAQQSRMLDFAARRSIVSDIYRLALDWSVLLPTGNATRTVGWQPWVRNEPAGPSQFFDEWDRWEQTWFDR